ncbi:MAG: hypothetical protein LBM59_03895 [Ruminococcus sp.]|jgi:hypothetical protein|nr:hypothetical protein [Ruminococcus sp.]
MNISNLSKSDLYSLVTGNDLAFIQADIKHHKEYTPEQLRQFSEKSIDTTDFMSLYKSGLNPSGDLNSDETVARKIADVGLRIENAYKNGKLNDSDYSELKKGFEQYKIDYPNSVEIDRARAIAHKEIGKAYFGNPYARVGVSIFDAENDIMRGLFAQAEKPWAIDRENLNKMIFAMMFGK